MICICHVSGQLFDQGRAQRILRGQRFIVGWECNQCRHQWISILPVYERCPECKSMMTIGKIQHIICPVHGCRGPQDVWVSHKMKEANIPCAERSVLYYVQKLQKGEHFTHARFGDGDWLTILGYTHLKNSNGCSFSDELGDAVRQVLRNNHDYDHVILDHPNWRFGLHIQQFMHEQGIVMDWAGEWLLPAMLSGELFPLFEQIRQRRVLYVGPHDISDFVPLVGLLHPPPQNSFEARKTIVHQVTGWIEQQGVDLVLWSCGGGGKPMIDDVFDLTKGEITQLDLGSVLDGYFPPLPHVNQKGSRSWVRKGGYDWDMLFRMNLKGEQ